MMLVHLNLLSIATVPTVEIAPGVKMPFVNVGTWSYGNGQPSDPSIGVSNVSYIFSLLRTSVTFIVLMARQ